MGTTHVTTGRWEDTGLEIARVDPRGAQRMTAQPARTHPGELDEQMIIEETQAGKLTVEQASRLAVTALAADLEYWARTVAVDGRVGLNDLTRALDTVRETSVPTA
jgi:hypothetical protein